MCWESSLGYGGTEKSLEVAGKGSEGVVKDKKKERSKRVWNVGRAVRGIERNVYRSLEET